MREGTARCHKVEVGLEYKGIKTRTKAKDQVRNQASRGYGPKKRRKDSRLLGR